MAKRKNKEILESITQQNLLGMNKSGLVNLMEKVELAGQRVFYVWLKQNGYKIQPEQMDQNQSDGIFNNAIVECKLNEDEGGGTNKAYLELYDIIPKRLKQNGKPIPFYRIYVELETFYVEVYDCHCKLVDKFDWYYKPEKFKAYFESNEKTYEYDLLDTDVDLVEVIQNIYKCFGIQEKMEAYKKLEDGVIGWFKPFNIKKCNINKLILNNDKMNEKYVQKREGAFFTPPVYIKISTDYVKQAIKQSKKEGYDNYVIIDRCVGVGNLQSQFEPEHFSHFIMGTINQAEALTANIRFGDLANVSVMDSLSKEGVDFYITEINKYIKKNKVKKLAVIFLENPPYINQSSNVGVKQEKNKDHSYIWGLMSQNSGKQDLYNQFIWSAWNFYKPYAYILYSPIKYWKLIHLEQKKFINGFLCDGKLFNAKQSRGISLIHWKNKKSNVNSLTLDSLSGNQITINKINTGITKYQNDCENPFSKMTIISPTTFANSISNVLLTDSDKKHSLGGKVSLIGKGNLTSQLPLFVVNAYADNEFKSYEEIDVLMKSGDGNGSYMEDKIFINDCLLYSLCSDKNHCSSNNLIWNEIDNLLSKENKNTKLYKTYKSLVKETSLNGLYNIKKFNKLEFGKLWKEHNLYPKIKSIENELHLLLSSKLKPKFFKHQLLK